MDGRGDTQTITNPDGTFLLEASDSSFSSQILEIRGDQFPGSRVYAHKTVNISLFLDHEIHEGFENIIHRPMFLPEIDLANAVTIDPTVDTLYTTDAIPGLSIFIKAGTVLGGWLPGTMADAIEEAFLKEWNDRTDYPLGEQGQTLRRVLFSAIAQGVVKHLAENSEAFKVEVSVQQVDPEVSPILQLLVQVLIWVTLTQTMATTAILLKVLSIFH